MAVWLAVPRPPFPRARASAAQGITSKSAGRSHVAADSHQVSKVSKSLNDSKEGKSKLATFEAYQIDTESEEEKVGVANTPVGADAAPAAPPNA